jgi:hypothetical protein
MQLSWTGLKISIAGARLSHLVQKDSIWDHGSMIEQARTVFIYLKKACLKGDPFIVKKCTTSEGYNTISHYITLKKADAFINADLKSVEIIAVYPQKNGHRDKFKALIKFEKIKEVAELKGFYKKNVVSEQEWCFAREGNWWLLDSIKK